MGLSKFPMVYVYCKIINNCSRGFHLPNDAALVSIKTRNFEEGVHLIHWFASSEVDYYYNWFEFTFFFLLFQTLKMKSSHDLLNDPKLSKQPAVENTISSVKVSLIYVCNCPAIFRGELIIDTWKCYMYLFCSSHHVWQFCCLHVSSHLESTHVQNAVKLLLWQGADIRNISYRNSVWWPNYIIKSVDKTKLSHITRTTSAPQFL